MSAVTPASVPTRNMADPPAAIPGMSVLMSVDATGGLDFMISPIIVRFREPIFRGPVMDLHLDLDGLARHAAAQIAAGLRDAVRSGRLAAGTRLPPSRTLAADIGVSRGPVVEAYEQLAAEGLLVSRQGAGTWVAGRPGRPTGQRGAADPA